MVGLIGEKIGMTQFFLENGNVVPVSVIKIDNNIILNKRNSDRDGYDSLVLGYKDISEKRLNSPEKGFFVKNGVAPKKYLKEFRVSDNDSHKNGDELTLESLQDVKFVDITGVSKGKGFQGVVKKYGFGGGRKTHGSKFHREPGSTGQNTYPGRCFKNRKMPGRMGRENVTVQNLVIMKIDTLNKVIFVKGAVPGKNNGILYIKKSVKKG